MYATVPLEGFTHVPEAVKVCISTGAFSKNATGMSPLAFSFATFPLSLAPDDDDTKSPADAVCPEVIAI
jgi:hypothetical protein